MPLMPFPEKNMKQLAVSDETFSIQPPFLSPDVFGSLPRRCFDKIFQFEHESKNHHHTKKSRP